jgi:hypothetical protein
MAGELTDLRMARPHETAETVLAHPESREGRSARCGQRPGVLARASTDDLKRRVMVHISKTAPRLRF